MTILQTAAIDGIREYFDIVNTDKITLETQLAVLSIAAERPRLFGYVAKKTRRALRKAARP